VSKETERIENWRISHLATPDKMVIARAVLKEIQSGHPVMDALRRHPLPGGGYLNKAVLVAAYHEMVAAGEFSADARFLERIRMKPMRTLSGVTTVTVLTKAYPCPGKCIFCPTDVRMPKSYLPGEPGAMRGMEHGFDPYLQVRSRIEQLESVGHPTDKIELLILGGTWSSYKRDYQEWFIKRCFDAMNDPPLASPHLASPNGETEGGLGTGELTEAHAQNESSPHRNVGLVIETRPEEINPDEIRWLTSA
jgi:elongator complex protein 3